MRLRVFARLLLVTCIPAAHGTAAQSSTNSWQLKTPDAESPNSLTLTLLAQQEVKGWLRSGRPVLTIQCSGGTVAAYVETGVALEVTQVDQQVVRARFDDADFRSERWQEVGNWTIAPHRPARLIAQLLHSQRFLLEFTPFSSGPAQAVFAVEGLDHHSRRLATYCGIGEPAKDILREREK